MLNPTESAHHKLQTKQGYEKVSHLSAHLVCLQVVEERLIASGSILQVRETFEQLLQRVRHAPLILLVTSHCSATSVGDDD